MLLDLSWHWVTEQRCSLHSYAPFYPRQLMNITGWFTEKLKMLSRGIHSHRDFPGGWWSQRSFLLQAFHFLECPCSSHVTGNGMSCCSCCFSVILCVSEINQSEQRDHIGFPLVRQVCCTPVPTSDKVQCLCRKQWAACVIKIVQRIKQLTQSQTRLLFRKINFFRASAELTFNAHLFLVSMVAMESNLLYLLKYYIQVDVFVFPLSATLIFHSTLECT